jgi:hypothetical protein
MEYGRDFLLDAEGDIVFTEDGDVAVASGAALVAQDIVQTLSVVPGALVWDTDAGSALLLALNDSGASNGAIIAELERVALDHPRVDPDSVKAEQVAQGKYRLTFTPLGIVTPETLDFDLTQGGGHG